MSVLNGLDRLIADKNLQRSIKGKIGLLCHSASVDKNYSPAPSQLITIFGDRLVTLFGPQHGFQTDVQDNMVETSHFTHPYFKRKVYSLYSETRIPTQQMLEDLDTIIVDLQDAGCRIYTYIYTLTYLMEACKERDIEVVVLDRPNPIGGEKIEGNILKEEFSSFVGRHPIPSRHGLTIGEVALMAKKYWGHECNLRVIEMQGWKRSMYYDETGCAWVLPSPNYPTINSALCFPASVLFEGTNISEGRGTTISLEVIGHPNVEAYGLCEQMIKVFKSESFYKGFILRPHVFLPTFQKHQGKNCGGIQIHVTQRNLFSPWRVGQILLREFYHILGDNFKWKIGGYEYIAETMPAIDVINGDDALRKWVENKGSLEELEKFEQLDSFLDQRDHCLRYS